MVEEEIIFTSLEHELLCLDGVVESSEECMWACEDEGVGYEPTHIVNIEVKEIEDTHKTLLKNNQLWQGQINSHLEMVDRQKNQVRVL